MELKLTFGNSYCTVTSSNCTFMELKFTLDGTHQQVAIRSNCTFMELK